MKKIKKIAFLFCLLCACQTEPNTKDKVRSLPIAVVGKDTVRSVAWQARTEILALDSVKQASSYALFQLLKMYAIQAIAEKYNYTLADSMLVWEAMRIDSSTLRPDKIKQIKALCKTDAVYRELFIKESLYPRWLSLRYQADEQQHRAQAIEARDVFTQALIQDKIFEKDTFSLDKKKYVIRTFWLSEKGLESILPTPKDTTHQKMIDQSKKEAPDAKYRAEAQMNEKADLLTTQLFGLMKNLKEGQLHPRVIDAPEAFWVLRHSGKENNRYKVKMLEIPKEAFSIWLEREIKTVPIHFIDTKAWEELQKTIPNIKQLLHIKPK